MTLSMNQKPNTNETPPDEKGLLLTRKKVPIFLPSEYQRRVLETVDAARLIDGTALYELVGGKVNTFHTNARRLFDAGYLDRLDLNGKLDTARGRSPAVYALGPRGVDYLQASPKKNAPLTPNWLHHELTVARFYATVAKACRLASASLPVWERKFALPPLKPARLKLDEATAYETDACFEIAHTKTSSFFLEVDNATQPARRLVNRAKPPQTHQSDFWKKLLFYEELFKQEQEGGAQPLGIRWFRVLTLVPSMGRLQSLQELAREADLRKDKAGTRTKKGRGIFLFALQRDIQLSDPLRFLFEPMWHLPSDGPFPLFKREYWANHAK